MGFTENSWLLSLRMISVCEDKADPFDDFFFVLGLEDLDATTKDLDAIVDDLENH